MMKRVMVIETDIRRRALCPAAIAVWLSALFVCLVALCAPGKAYAQTTKAEYPEGRVILYNFQNAGATSEFGYYSYIIPDSIATELRRSKKYDIRSFPVIFEYVDPKAPEDVYKNRLRLLTERGKEFNADFVVTGSYSVEKRTIIIKTQIFDVHEQKIRDIHETSEEHGAMLLVIIDRISEKINTELQKGVAERLARQASSPYLPIYRALSGWSFGASLGKVEMHGPWGDVYENKTDSSSLYIRYDLAKSDMAKGVPVLRDTALSLQYDYLTADTRDTAEPVFSIYTLRSFSLSGMYLYRMESFFALAAGAGAGLAVSLVEIPGAEIIGPAEIIESRRSYDPFIQLSAGALFFFSRIELGAGIAWHHLFLADKGMDFTRLYFSVGYRL